MIVQSESGVDQRIYILRNARDLCAGIFGLMDEADDDKKNKVMRLWRHLQGAIGRFMAGDLPQEQSYREMSEMCLECSRLRHPGFPKGTSDLFTGNALTLSSLAKVEGSTSFDVAGRRS